MTMNNDNLLDIIIISKNEEENIARCIRSIFEVIKGIKNVNIVLVDSCSKDHTIEIAEKFEINIIQLSPSNIHTPSAGRYIGFLNTHCKYIQFIDGDMTIDNNWFDVAISELESDNELAAVAGIGTEATSHESIINKKSRERFGTVNFGEVPVLHGAVCYKRYVLDEIGTYNPHLFADEESELCYRIGNAGYKLVRVPHPMINHHGKRISGLQEIKRRWNNKYYIGTGQTLRYSMNDRILLLKHMLRLKLYLLVATWYFIGFLALFIKFAISSILFYTWCALSMLFVVVYTFKKRSLMSASFSIFSWTNTATGLIIGFIRNKKEPTEYPEDVTIIKKVDNLANGVQK